MIVSDEKKHPLAVRIYSKKNKYLGKKAGNAG